MRWLDSTAHTDWLNRKFADLIVFFANTIDPEGGFTWPTRDRGRIEGPVPQLYLTGRMAHVASMGVLRGIPGSQALLDHAVASLAGPFEDKQHGGWRSTRDTDGRKETYAQMFVALGASSAVVAGSTEAQGLLERVTQLIDTRLWDEEAGALVESFAADWSDPEAYRGANANMHGIEAMLALGDVTGDAKWHQRGLRIAERVIDREARQNGWAIPEHFDANWNVDLDYNRDEPEHPFRPYGSTPGHALEWGRLMLALYASPALGRPQWCLEASQALIDSGLSSWGADGNPGLPYTLDWDGKPVTALRLHWPVCEAIQVTALFDTVTQSDHYEGWYRRLWDHVGQHFIDDTATWANELSATLEPSERIWPGRVDAYHIAGAYLGPQAPASPFITLALAGESSRIG